MKRILAMHNGATTWPRWLSLALNVVFLGISSTAIGDMWIAGETTGNCQVRFPTPTGYTLGSYIGQTVQGIPQLGCYAIVDRWEVLKPSGELHAYCSEERDVCEQNQPSGPSSGSSRTSNDESSLLLLLEIMYGEIRQWLRDQDPCANWEKCGIQIKEPGQDAGGKEGKSGFILYEDQVGVPAKTSIFIGFDPTIESPPLGVPFLVESGGEDDWLAIALGDTVFFRAPLSNFDVGKYYIAEFPAGMTPSSYSVSFYLNSGGDADAVVFFPLEPLITVPALGSVTLAVLVGLLVLVGVARSRGGRG